MIGEQDGIVAFDQRLDGFSKFVRAGHAVRSDGNRAERNDEFAEQRFIEGHTRGSVAGSRGRMGVADGVDFRAASVDEQVHGEFG